MLTVCNTDLLTYPDNKTLWIISGNYNSPMPQIIDPTNNN